jgi:hypothetical protein
VELVNWRTLVPYPDAEVGIPLYDPATYVVTQKVDASKLPVREHVAMRITFTVNLGAASENRSVIAAIYVIA